MHEMLRLVLMGLDEADQDAIEVLCDADWDRVECVDGGYLAVRGRPERFLLEWEPEPLEEEPAAASAPAEPAELVDDMTLEPAVQDEQAERRAAREEYMALVKASVEDPDALWVECVDTEHHDPHWWLFEDPTIRRPGEYVGCTGAGWV